jgi:dihydrofolate reductase
MIVSLVVAMDEKGGIAWQGQLPWHLPTELKLFKRTTLGHHLLMGRKTFETIGKPLPGRTTIVITRQQDYASYAPEGCLVVHSLEEGLILARSKGETEVFVCGGREIYAQALPLADRMYLTTIHTVVPTDMNFPAFKPEEWLETSRLFIPADDKNPFAFTRQILEKKNCIKSVNAN